MAEDRTAARARMIQGFRNSSGRQGEWFARRNALMRQQQAAAQAQSAGIPATGPGSPQSFMAKAADMVRTGNVPPMTPGPDGRPQIAPGVDLTKFGVAPQAAGRAIPQAAQDAMANAQNRAAGFQAPIPAQGPTPRVPQLPTQASPNAVASLADRARAIQGQIGQGAANMQAAVAPLAPPVAAPVAVQAPQAAVPVLPAQAAPQAQQAVAQAQPAAPVAPPAPIQGLAPQAAPQAQQVAAPAVQAAPQAQAAVQQAQIQPAAPAQGQDANQAGRTLATAIQQAQQPPQTQQAAPAQSAPAAAPAQAQTQAQASQAAQQVQAAPAAPVAPPAPVAQPAPVAPPAPAPPVPSAFQIRPAIQAPKPDEMRAAVMPSNATTKNQANMATTTRYIK